MGDNSPQKQIKIGNLTIKLNPNNQQKNRRDSNYERNYYHKNNDRNNYNEKGRDNDREREKNKYRKKNDYDYRKEKYRNYKNKSNSNSSSGNKHRHSHHQNHSRSRSRTHSYHNNQNKNKNNNINDNKTIQTDIKKNNFNNNQNNNLNSSMNDSQTKNNDMNNNINNNLQNNQNNMAFNQLNQNYFNNYINSDFFKKFYQMNNQLGNNNTNNIIVPVGIPINYFYNPNINNMNQMNKNNNMNNPNNQNNQNTNNTQDNKQNQSQKQKEEPSNTLLITDLDTNITKEILEDIFREKSLNLQISMPVDIRLVEALNIAYIIFPSVTSCVMVYNSLINQKILINGKYFPVQFSPNLTSNYSNNRDTLTYVTQISSNTSLTTSMETTVHEDWYCVYCDTKNFSRRTVCFKCQKPKSINCRVVPVIKQKKIVLGANGEILPNNSIIVQGKQVQYSNEGEVFIFLLI